MHNSDTFLDSFAAIEKWLRAQAGMDRYVSFYQLTEVASKKNGVVSRYKDDLKEYADLRNAIVHERSDGHVIAEPNKRAVSAIQSLESLLLKPPKVIPTFQGRVCTVAATQALTEAVVTMYREAFSQLPVTKGQQIVGVLTANTIARWLGHEAEVDVFSLQETTVDDVLKYTEQKENHCFLSRSSTVFDALASFERFAERGMDLDAALITENGNPDEKLLGILTLSDLPKALGILRAGSLTAK